MSSTNKTTNYNLSQFIGSDKPAWLVDYNGDMAAIDLQMKANADAAATADTKASNAGTAASGAASGVSTLDAQINGAGGLASDIVTAQGNINTINSLIGNGTPTTTDKTLIGAINELNSGKATSADITAVTGDLTQLTTTDKTNLVAAINEVASGQGGTVDADDVTFDNTGTGLIATNVQDAIEEVASKSVTLRATSGTGTIGQQIAQLENTFDALSFEEKVGAFIVMNNAVIFRICELDLKLFNNSRNVSTYFYNDTLGLGGTYIRANFVGGGTTTVTDNSSASATDGFFKLYA